MSEFPEVVARAHANIALAKYWGKADVRRNVPAVPSISLTLDQLVTETRVVFDPTLDDDQVRLDGRRSTGDERARVVQMLDRVRREARTRARARVSSHNRFPTAAGLASSASGFAALAAASTEAAGLHWKPRRLSALARASSASAARSIFGGFVELPAGGKGDDVPARPIAPRDHWDVRLVIAVTQPGPKKIGSTEGMERSRKTSPFYEAWVDKAPAWARTVKRAIKSKDLDALGAAMERSTLAFHCAAMTADPPIFYWAPATLAALETVRGLRERGVSVWATMDAGPHVKALCRARDAARVRQALDRTAGVNRTFVAKPGGDVEVQRCPR